MKNFLKKGICTTAIIIILFLGVSCSIEPDYAAAELVTVNKADSIDSKAFVSNIREDAQRVTSFSKYVIDVATADIYYYILVDPPANTSNYISQYQILIPTAKMLTRKVNLDSIDYVNSTWGIIGASNTKKQIQLNVMSIPTTLSYPSGVSSIVDIAGKGISSTKIEIYITLSTGTYGTYIRKGVYTKGASSISWDSTYTSTRFHGVYDSGLSIDGNYFYKLFNYMPSYFKRQTSLGGTVYKENLSPYTAHGYKVNGTLRKFAPFEFDFSTYGADFIFGLVRNGDTNDLVRMPKSNLRY